MVTLSQCRRLGLSDDAVQRRTKTGRLHRLHRGVYAVGHTKISLDGHRLAAVLACGQGAVLSHVSAAVVWGIRRGSEARFDVTTHHRGRAGPTGVRLHRVRASVEGAMVAGIPVTTVARTLLDLADVLAPAALGRAVHEAEHLRLLDMREVEGTLAAANGRRGVRRLEAALASPSAGVTRSVLEERFADLVAAWGLPTPRRNAHVPTRNGLVEVDVLWERERVIVELDGAAHRTRRAFEADRARDAALAAEGFVVVRLTWARVTRDEEGVEDELRRLLAARR